MLRPALHRLLVPIIIIIIIIIITICYRLYGSYSVLAIYDTCNVISHDKRFVL